MANIYPHFPLAVPQPFLVLSHLAHPLAVCPPLHVPHLDGSHRRHRVVMGSGLKDERSDDEGDDDEDEDEDAALQKKKRS